MSVARAIIILQDIRERLELEVLLAEESSPPLAARYYSDKIEACEIKACAGARERWALEKLDKAIALLRPHVGY